MQVAPDSDSSADKLTAYLSECLHGLGIHGWTVSVIKGSETDTRDPDGISEPSVCDDELPGSGPCYEVSEFSDVG